MNKFLELIGKKIIDSRYDGDTLYLNLDNNECASLKPAGDCCAICYIQHISYCDALINATIMKIEDIDCFVSQAEKANNDVVEAWGHSIKTNKGVCSIEMRLIHNGYYGGNLYLSLSNGHNNCKLLEDF